MKRTAFNTIRLLLLALVFSGCTEQYVMQTNTFEDALVVEATITNEMKQQQVKITRTYPFEQNGPTSEAGAQVSISDNDGNNYEFFENSGVYLSTSAFQALPGKAYQL